MPYCVVCAVTATPSGGRGSSKNGSVTSTAANPPGARAYLTAWCRSAERSSSTLPPTRPPDPQALRRHHQRRRTRPLQQPPRRHQRQDPAHQQTRLRPPQRRPPRRHDPPLPRRDHHPTPHANRGGVYVFRLYPQRHKKDKTNLGRTEEGSVPVLTSVMSSIRSRATRAHSAVSSSTVIRLTTRPSTRFSSTQRGAGRRSGTSSSTGRSAGRARRSSCRGVSSSRRLHEVDLGADGDGRAGRRRPRPPG